MSDVLTLRVGTGRSDVFYPSLKPVIVHSALNVEVDVAIDPDSQELLLNLRPATDANSFSDAAIITSADGQPIISADGVTPITSAYQYVVTSSEFFITDSNGQTILSSNNQPLTVSDQTYSSEFFVLTEDNQVLTTEDGNPIEI